MKHAVSAVICLCLAIVLLGGCNTLSIGNPAQTSSIPSVSPSQASLTASNYIVEGATIKEFDSRDVWSAQVDHFVHNFQPANFGLNPEECYLGSTPDKDDALDKGEKILSKIYGSEKIKEEYPLHVSYDEKYSAWVVHGSLPEGLLGGVAVAIFQKDDGKIIAVWHGK